MGKEHNTKKYDHAQAIGEHLRNLSQQISSLEETDSKNWSSYFNSIMMSISLLDAMLDPFKPDDFQEVFQKNQSFGSTKGEQVQFVHTAMKHYFNLMKEKELFYASYSEDTMGSKKKQ